MDEEYDSLIWNQTWELVPLPLGRKIVQCRWIYQTKMEVMDLLASTNLDL
jgi:hypothetical protein